MLIILIVIAGGLFFMAHLTWRLVLGKPTDNYIPILAYHKVDMRFELGGTRTTPEKFERQMAYIKSQGIYPVTFSRAVELMKGKEGKIQKYICITFDDAYEGLYNYAWPILKKYGLSATIFVVTDYVGVNNDWDVSRGPWKFRHLDWNQIIEMSESGIEFGSHSRTHQDLRQLDDDELKSELEGSKNILEKYLGKKIQILCYPFGRYNQKVIDVAASCGYNSACSLSPKIKNSQIDFMAIRRSAIYITDIMWSFKNKIYQDGTWFWLQDLWCRIVNFCAAGTIIMQKAYKLITSKKRGKSNNGNK